jgi:hypothetical protein
VGCQLFDFNGQENEDNGKSMDLVDDEIAVINDPVVGNYKILPSEQITFSLHKGAEKNAYFFDQIDDVYSIKMYLLDTAIVIPEQNFKIKNVSAGGAVFLS